MAANSTEACAVAMAMAAPFLAMVVSSSVPATGNVEKRRRTSSDALQRTVSDVSNGLRHNHHGEKEKEKETEEQQQPHPVRPEVVNAKCECCGMSEECTPGYIRGVRGRFAGRWVCGLCAAAVTEEAGKNGGDLKEALRAHTAVSERFNGFGRTHPVLFQAEAMRELLRRRAKLGPRSLSTINPREVRAGGGIARSSSCMPFITDDESNDRVSINKH